MSRFDRYQHYENSVQTPEEHVQIFDRIFSDLRKKQALSLREDFCGTFLISREWAKSHPKRFAQGLDLDPEPLAYGKKHTLKGVKPSVRKRIRPTLQDVCIPTRSRFDVIGAGNFSFFIFKTEEQLLKYFKAAFTSLNRDGMLILEMAGGPGFIKTAREQRTYRVPSLGKFTYYWDQKKYDPIQNHGLYAIHFKDQQGRFHRDCFTYDWRIWNIPELRALMKKAGFKDSAVYWEEEGRDGEGSGVWSQAESGDNAYSWIAFLVGIK